MQLNGYEIKNSLKFSRVIKELKFTHRKEVAKDKIDDEKFCKQHGEAILKRYAEIGGVVVKVKVTKEKVEKKVEKKNTKEKRVEIQKEAAPKKKVVKKAKKKVAKKKK